MLMKSVIGALVALGLGVVPALAEYPAKEIKGIIQWGAGGSTDTVARAITPHAQAVLGGTIVMQNVTGGVGAIGLNQVANDAADGYSILFGAENPLLYKVMGLGDKDYSDFVPVNIIARGVPILVANVDAPFNTFPEMVAYINANPKAVKFGSTGPGGLPSVVTAMINSKTPLDVTFVPYDGDGPALTALQGKAIDVMPAVLGAAIEGIRGGTMKPLAMFDIEPSPQLPDVPTIVSTNPEFAEMLPWGPFFGVFVKNGTPDDVVAKLTAAYAEAATHPDFVALIDGRGFKMLSLAGAEAEEFLTGWQSTTSWLIHEAGMTKASPEDFGIVKP
ncbi:MAG: tripartite tricarboxylate transporter substrate binding protein [Pseudotabrizicola sp.]|uniref:tripartite tricarboxylate transporter substrate binding protein n=1 Tax=Pseudotabrizicola sp. TaxID=2939647 RepID=UPI00271DB23B|nr:tripartite tricarboxylate transporter substrate binding protein [Pseudotabrizicola sp.]MDO8882799.1 tripartite tricarboxylate transporter substrate binding protein [Pseudotabrizicola sp.]MDP2080514.1 tripartite tricarboxylate transporter substrate binding protein [Pseudotabrizicola sp.]MDZ7573128.1 tripartite tricarboxylate transporter substrate binding protein [Pseudotabrizicola sp.]